jgi:cellulose synthase/poly-beta-1,6-N-acetylglucosamine synthase-like glycosyltransferase
MNLIDILWVIAQAIIGYNLVLPVLLYIIYLFTRKRDPDIVLYPEEPDYAIIVTAYEQTSMLPSVVNSLLRLNYSNYIIYIVADKCDISGLQFTDPRVVLLRPEETLASHTASHFFAIRHFRRDHERLTIIDSDNLVESGYLNHLNIFFNHGFHAVQGTRAPKNLDTTLACLDAARDIYYHFYDGKVLYQLGSSSTLAGSGMAFTTKLYKECLGDLRITGSGFDKILQYQLVKRKYRIAFAEKAIVYDEKTSRPEQLVKQRARWINTWFQHFSLGFSLLAKGITHFNLNQFLFGLILLRPPLFIFLLLSVCCFIINLFIYPALALIWLGAIGLFAAGFGIALLHSGTDRRIYQSLANAPRFMFYQLRSLWKVRKANKYSVATTHFHENKQ